jgi:hypothetical protein
LRSEANTGGGSGVFEKPFWKMPKSANDYVLSIGGDHGYWQEIAYFIPAAKIQDSPYLLIYRIPPFSTKNHIILYEKMPQRKEVLKCWLGQIKNQIKGQIHASLRMHL